MSDFGLILASHGEFARAALESAEMIVGKQEKAIACTLNAEDSLEVLEKSIKDAYYALKKKYDDVLVLCDIYGGSPFNAVSRLKLKGLEMKAYTCLSLPLLIDLLLASDVEFDDIECRIKETHNAALAEIKVEVANDESDLDL